jgi:hypothetical protein
MSACEFTRAKLDNTLGGILHEAKILFCGEDSGIEKAGNRISVIESASIEDATFLPEIGRSLIVSRMQ